MSDDDFLYYGNALEEATDPLYGKDNGGWPIGTYIIIFVVMLGCAICFVLSTPRN